MSYLFFGFLVFFGVLLVYRKRFGCGKTRGTRFFYGCIEGIIFSIILSIISVIKNGPENLDAIWMFSIAIFLSILLGFIELARFEVQGK